MRVPNAILSALLVFLACGDDPMSATSWPRTGDEVIESLARAYRQRNVGLFNSLLVNDPDRGAEYVFVLSAPTDLGETEWGYQEEARIHQRMFDPAHPPPGESPPAPEIWLQSVAVNLTKQQSFAERTDLYTTSDPPGPLDPSIWRALGARYSTYVFFDMVGIDYKVEGEANFVVIEDLTKNVGDQGKFFLYIWDEMSTSAKSAAVEPKSWSSVKQLFR